MGRDVRLWMPGKSLRDRVTRAKRAGTTVTLKETDFSGRPRRSRHATKKSGNIVAKSELADRNVSPRVVRGLGKTATSRRLPLPETGSSSSRRKTTPGEVASHFRKGPRTKTRTR